MTSEEKQDTKDYPVQFSSVQLFATPRTAGRQASLSITNSWSLLKLMSLSQWRHPTISSTVIPFSSHLQSFPASGSFQMSQLFASGGQRIRVSASASVLPMNTQDWSPSGWTGWISLLSKGTLKSLMFRSDQISRSVLSYSLRPHESQHARPPCPSPTPGVH